VELARCVAKVGYLVAFTNTICTLAHLAILMIKLNAVEVWLQQPALFPEWFRPDKSKIIVTQRDYKYDCVDADGETHISLEYWQIIECGDIIDSRYLNWLIIQSMHHNINIEYQVNGKWYYLGSEQFKAAFGNKVTSSAQIQE
jgi:hypothetical protein